MNGKVTEYFRMYKDFISTTENDSITRNYSTTENDSITRN